MGTPGMGDPPDELRPERDPDDHERDPDGQGVSGDDPAESDEVERVEKMLSEGGPPD